MVERCLISVGVLLLLVPSAAATPPADAFCVITIQAFDDFKVVRYTIDLETNLTERQRLFPQVDTDQDGAVEPWEADAYTRDSIEFWPEANGLGVKAVRLSWEGIRLASADQEPFYAATWFEIGHTFHQREYQLPDTITDASDLETQEVREFRFNAKAPLQAVVSGGIDPVRPPPPDMPTDTETVTPEYVVIRAPDNWTVASVVGRTYDGRFAANYTTNVVDIPAFDTKSPYTITFARDESGTAAPATGLLIPLLLVASALARRHFSRGS